MLGVYFKAREADEIKIGETTSLNRAGVYIDVFLNAGEYEVTSWETEEREDGTTVFDFGNTIGLFLVRKLK